MKKILLVDDHEMMLDGVERLIQDETEYDVVKKATSVAACMDSLAHLEVDLIITDYNLPDEDGLSLVKKVKKLYPETKIIVLSMHDEAHLVKEILKSGVNAYILKKDSQSELINALQAVSQGKIYLSNDINAMLVKNLGQPDEIKLLTSRELEVLKLISKELSNKMIAEKLFISERTVETHRKNIFRKTGTSTLVGLIKFAYANNLI